MCHADNAIQSAFHNCPFGVAAVRHFGSFKDQSRLYTRGGAHADAGTAGQ